MNNSIPICSVCETLVADSQIVFPLSPVRIEHPASVLPGTTNPLERLAQLMVSNERLMDDLATSRGRISDARAYLDRSGCSVRFGEAHLERCRIKHTGILSQLRANRIEALQLLGPAHSSV